jgi:hypothetical protein
MATSAVTELAIASVPVASLFETKETPVSTPADPTPSIRVATAVLDATASEPDTVVPPAVHGAEQTPDGKERTLVAHSYPASSAVVSEPILSSQVRDVSSDDSAVAPLTVPSPAVSGDDDVWLADVRNQSAKDARERGRRALASVKRRWDIQFLYFLFPELDPSYRPEFQTPVVDFRNSTEASSQKISRKIQILSWFYPDLELHSVGKRQRQRRRAPRIPEPGLVAFYFSGGHAFPHEVKHLSVMGFYMVTDQRWMPGTVLRVTLQMKESDGDPRDTLTVLSRVVNWDKQGGGFEFVLPGFID